jgi:hypothetical protein
MNSVLSGSPDVHTIYCILYIMHTCIKLGKSSGQHTSQMILAYVYHLQFEDHVMKCRLPLHISTSEDIQIKCYKKIITYIFPPPPDAWCEPFKTAGEYHYQ